MRQLVEKTPAHARYSQDLIERLGEEKAIKRQAVPRSRHATRPVANSGSVQPLAAKQPADRVALKRPAVQHAAQCVAQHAAQHAEAQVITQAATAQPAKDKSFTECFERKEDKYLLSAEQFRHLFEVASRYLKPDEHGQTQVRSLYYDTPAYELIERSLDKPLYKEKLRVRSYGLPTEASPVFVEIKKKFEDVVYKRRVCMTSIAASRYLEGMPYREAYLSAPLAEPYSAAQAFSPIAVQTVKEINVFLTRYGRLQPSMLITCDRRAYVDPEGSGLRITFDSNIIADPTASDLFGSDGIGVGAAIDGLKSGEAKIGEAKGGGLGAAKVAKVAKAVNPGTPITHSGEILMEIKSEGSLPLWLAHLLSECKAYPQSFSKYGNAYLMLCRDKVYGDKTGARKSM